MKARVALLASIFSLGLVAVVAAQVSTTTGTVVSNSGGVLVVDTDSGQRTFMVDAQSSVPADLAAGTRVTVEYHTLANDKFHAFKVTPSGTTPSTTTSTTDTYTTGTTGSTTGTTGTTGSMTGSTPTNPNTGSTSTAGTTGSTSMQERPTTSTTTGAMQDRPTTTGNDTTTAPSTDTTGTMADDTSTTGRKLPATASPLPLLALAGSLALAGGALLRRRRA